MINKGFSWLVLLTNCSTVMSIFLLNCNKSSKILSKQLEILELFIYNSDNKKIQIKHVIDTLQKMEVYHAKTKQ